MSLSLRYRSSDDLLVVDCFFSARFALGVLEQIAVLLNSLEEQFLVIARCRRLSAGFSLRRRHRNRRSNLGLVVDGFLSCVVLLLDLLAPVAVVVASSTALLEAMLLSFGMASLLRVLLSMAVVVLVSAGGFVTLVLVVMMAFVVVLLLAVVAFFVAALVVRGLVVFSLKGERG